MNLFKVQTGSAGDPRYHDVDYISRLDREPKLKRARLGLDYRRQQQMLVVARVETLSLDENRKVADKIFLAGI